MLHVPEVAWTEGPHPPPTSAPRIERFRGGGKKTVILLRNPQVIKVHWNAELKCSVPCFGVGCPFCNDRKFTKTQRVEGYGASLVLNFEFRRWEAAVCVFTKLGLDKLAEVGKPKGPPYRGRIFEIHKVPTAGRSDPMEVKEIAQRLPDNFPSLPEEFDAKNVMMRVWFPGVDHKDPLPVIPPIPAERKRRPSTSTHDPLVIPAEQAAELTARLHAFGLKGMARTVETESGVPQLEDDQDQAEPIEFETPEAPAVPIPVPEPARPSGQPVIHRTRSKDAPLAANERGLDTMSGALGAVLGTQGASPSTATRGSKDASPSALHPRTVSPMIFGENNSTATEELPKNTTAAEAKVLLESMLRDGGANAVRVAQLRAIIKRGNVPEAAAEPTTRPKIFNPEDPLRDQHGLSDYDYAAMSTMGTAEIVCAETKANAPESHPIKNGTTGRKAVP
jgi:hypothetical protein